MIRNLPKYYHKSKVMKDIYEITQAVVDKVSAEIDIKERDLFLETSQDLTLHERDVGLINEADDSLTAIKVKIKRRLQGCENFTIPELKKTLEELDIGTFTVAEFPKEYIIRIALNEKIQSQKEYQALCEVISELKLAHIAIEFAFTENTWEDISKKTWGELAETTWWAVKTYEDL